MKKILTFTSFALILISCGQNEKFSGTALKNSRSEPEKEPEKADTSVITSSEAPAFYTMNDFNRADLSLRKTLREITSMKEVRRFCDLNNDSTLFWVMENNIYDTNMFRVNVGLDYGTYYSSAFKFYVNKRSREIRILEVVDDSIMTLKDWRKSKYYRNYSLDL